MHRWSAGRKGRRLAGLSTFVVLLGSLATANVASADFVWSNHSGTICKNLNADEVARADYLISGIIAVNRGPLDVICPLVRSTLQAQGATIYVDVYHSSQETTSCTAYSLRPGGRLLGSATSSFTGSGTHRMVLDLVGPGKSLWTSAYSVLCTLPGYGTGIVTGVHLAEKRL